MRRRRKPFLFLFFALFSLGSLIYLISSFPPDYELRIMNHELGIIFAFFFLLFLSAFYLFSYLLNNKRRGFFIGVFITLYFLLRLFGLTHLFFLILLL
ncbi:MAG: hypothetical protein HYZ02_03045, partial [Candidatus Levybacteria bacterium]|nr:hypothetical protein [Candidatus Levybacteria bacterium]